MGDSPPPDFEMRSPAAANGMAIVKPDLNTDHCTEIGKPKQVETALGAAWISATAGEEGGASMSARQKLPNRRHSISFYFGFEGHRYRATASRHADGRLAEIFLDTGKPAPRSKRRQRRPRS